MPPASGPSCGSSPGFITAHNLLYTYIQPLASRSGAGQIEWVLLVFGVAALLSIWATGQLVDRHHRGLMLVSGCLLGASAAVLGVAFLSPAILYLGSRHGVWASAARPPCS